MTDDLNKSIEDAAQLETKTTDELETAAESEAVPETAEAALRQGDDAAAVAAEIADQDETVAVQEEAAQEAAAQETADRETPGQGGAAQEVQAQDPSAPEAATDQESATGQEAPAQEPANQESATSQEAPAQEPAPEATGAAPAAAEKPKKKRKGLIIGIVVAIVLVACAGAYCFIELIPSMNYQKAVDSMNNKDYPSAVATFSSMPNYQDSMSNIYTIFKDIAGQGYVDEATEGVSYMTNYIEAQSRDLISFARGLSFGDEGSWSPSLDDPNLQNMNSTVSKLNARKSEFDKTFTTDVIKACGDSTLSTACTQFNEVHSAVTKMLSTQNAMTYVYEMAQGSLSTMTADVTRATSAINNYTKTVNNMK